MTEGGQVFRAELVASDPSAAGGNAWVRFVRWVIMSPAMWLVAAANLVGAALGFHYWYGDTLLETPWYYWIFVPDCPLAAAFMGLALIFFHYGRRWDWLGLLAVGTCVKYGVWTVFYWAANYSAGGVYNFESVTMSITHFIMVVEGLMLTAFLRYRVWPILVAGMFLVTNDLVDYVAGYHPGIPELVEVGLMQRVAVSMSVIIVVFWVALVCVSWWRRREAGDGGVAGAR